MNASENTTNTVLKTGNETGSPDDRISTLPELAASEGLALACGEECHVVASEFELVSSGPTGALTMPLNAVTRR